MATPILIEIPAKSSKKEPDFVAALSKEVKKSGANPADFAESCSKLIELRKHATAPEASLDGVRRLEEYLGQLRLARSKFNFSVGDKYDTDQVKLPFSWQDLYKAEGLWSRGETESYSIHFEVASVVFQLAALHTRLAAAADLRNEVGCKDAADHCKKAAGYFTGLVEFVEANFSSSPSPDFDKEKLQFLATLSKAQGLECVLQKVYRDCKAESCSPVLAAKISNMASSDFGDAVSFAKQTKVLGRFVGDVTAKQQLYKGEAFYWQGEVEVKSGNGGYGKQVTRLEVAAREMSAAASTLAWAGDRVQRVQSALKEAKKDNNVVYMERTPSEDDLPDIGVLPKHMIASSMMRQLPDWAASCGPGLFAALISVELSRAAEDYRQQRSDVVERITKKACRLETKNGQQPRGVEPSRGTRRCRQPGCSSCCVGDCVQRGAAERRDGVHCFRHRRSAREASNHQSHHRRCDQNARRRRARGH
jgi:hypothetical protein